MKHYKETCAAEGIPWDPSAFDPVWLVGLPEGPPTAAAAELAAVEAEAGDGAAKGSGAAAASRAAAAGGGGGGAKEQVGISSDEAEEGEIV